MKQMIKVIISTTKLKERKWHLIFLLFFVILSNETIFAIEDSTTVKRDTIELLLEMRSKEGMQGVDDIIYRPELFAIRYSKNLEDFSYDEVYIFLDSNSLDFIEFENLVSLIPDSLMETVLLASSIVSSNMINDFSNVVVVYNHELVNSKSEIIPIFYRGIRVVVDFIVLEEQWLPIVNLLYCGKDGEEFVSMIKVKRNLVVNLKYINGLSYNKVILYPEIKGKKRKAR